MYADVEQLIAPDPRQRASHNRCVAYSGLSSIVARAGEFGRYVAYTVFRMINVNDLALAAENEFAFLEALGLPLVEWSEISPESFKGGFKLIFRSQSGKEVVVNYTDCEFEVHADQKEIFGPNQHPQFAGNMFSREHLIGALPKIRQSIESSLSSFASPAT